VREPTNDEQRLMILGDFDALEEYLEWMNTPPSPEEQTALDKLGERAIEMAEFDMWLEEGEEPEEDEIAH